MRSALLPQATAGLRSRHESAVPAGTRAAHSRRSHQGCDIGEQRYPPWANSQDAGIHQLSSAAPLASRLHVRQPALHPTAANWRCSSHIVRIGGSARNRAEVRGMSHGGIETWCRGRKAAPGGTRGALCVTRRWPGSAPQWTALTRPSADPNGSLTPYSEPHPPRVRQST